MNGTSQSADSISILSLTFRNLTFLGFPRISKTIGLGTVTLYSLTSFYPKLTGNSVSSFSLGHIEHMKHDPKGITTALQLYFSGESLRNVQKSLRLLRVQVCHRTVYNWIQKYTELINKYRDKITLNVSDTWRADEIYVKVKGNPKYLFAMMDDETRFWIAQIVDTKDRHDARNLFAMAKDRAGKKPDTIITDGQALITEHI